MKEPRGTYRVQLNAGFGFDQAAEAAEYLAALGVSHIYCSPYLQAAPGSMHGYDVVDHHKVNEELGGEAAHERFCRRLGELGLGQVLDIVPNHMAAVGRANPWWWDILENGPASRYAPYFDIEWNPPEDRLRNKVLLPILGERYGVALAAGEVRLRREGGAFSFRYHDHEFPASPRSTGALLANAAARSGSQYLGFLADLLAHLPSSHSTDWPSIMTRHRDKEMLKELLAGLCRDQQEIAAKIDECVEELNGDAAEMDALLSRQNYRIAYWRSAERELGYRRFFDVNNLVGLRMENDGVFDDTHELTIDWLRRGVIDGVRVDHPDGLSDPRRYLERLREAAPEAWIVVEKILMPGESLPADWPVAGTTGYDFLDRAGRLFVDVRGEASINEIYREFTGAALDWAAMMREKKDLVLTEILGSDVNRLTALFLQICEQDWTHRDYTRHEIHEAIREAVAAFPVYRTYVQPDAGKVTEADAGFIHAGIAAAIAGRPELDEALFRFLERVLTLDAGGALGAEFVMLFQQVTGPAMAKGVEDTAFYCYLRLASLNEVGGSPERFGETLDEFHQFCGRLQEQWPLTMVTTGTHDTKRGEDVRLRIAQLSGRAAAWGETVKRWSAQNERYKSNRMPDRTTEYLLYQTMVGAWPISRERLQAYMLKAVREAKELTSWRRPDAAFEEALAGFIDGVMGDAAFVADLEEFTAPVVKSARHASVAHTLLKMTAAGVPDIYQGSELWDLRLVDPDNRSPVDFPRRKELLKEMEGLGPEEIALRTEDGLPKLWTIRQSLRVRAERPRSFGAQGTYRPLWASGPRSGDVVAFERGADIAVMARRGYTGDVDNSGWSTTFVELRPGKWCERLTGEMVDGGRVDVERLLRTFPAALLVLEEGSGTLGP